MIGFLVLAIALSFSLDVAPSGASPGDGRRENRRGAASKKQLTRRHKKRLRQALWKIVNCKSNAYGANGSKML
jgi:hypothetical protein